MSSRDLRRALELLGVDLTADDAAIRKAWRALVRSYHPDLARIDREAANRRLAEINAAYDIVAAFPEAERTRLLKAEARARAARRAAFEAARQAERAREAETRNQRDSKRRTTEPPKASKPEMQNEQADVPQSLSLSAIAAFEAAMLMLRTTARPASQAVYA